MVRLCREDGRGAAGGGGNGVWTPDKVLGLLQCMFYHIYFLDTNRTHTLQNLINDKRVSYLLPC